jgi:4-hydroxymandelate oxidase
MGEEMGDAMDEKLLTVDDFEEAARHLLPRATYSYIRAGADEERALRANREAFSAYELWYRVLVDVASPSTATTVLGRHVSLPILISPAGYQRLAHADGEIATARGAARAATIFTLSTVSTVSLEDVAAASDGAKWFQLYVYKDRGLTQWLVERAERAGYEALVLTVDLPVVGRRLADERHGFHLPPGMTIANLEGRAAMPEDFEGSLLTAYFSAHLDPSVTWKDVAWLRSITHLPVILKGIVRPDDASRAVDEGVEAIVVSNHGGRQLDTAPASIHALAEVAEAVDGRCELLMDGGICCGNDVLTALALGARAVMVGRAVLWGLAVGGEEGVIAVLDLLAGELRRAMVLAGCPDVASASRDLVRRRSS